MQNIQNPVTGSRLSVTPEEFLRSYSDFDAAYRFAIREELRSTRRMSEARRLALEGAAKEGGTIDLGLLSLRPRQMLRRQLMDNVLGIEQLIKSFGLPSLYFPSNNPISFTTKMFAVNEPGRYHPMVDFLQQIMFSIDPRAQAGANVDPMDSLKIGTGTLPSALEMEQNVARGGRNTIDAMMQTALSPNAPAQRSVLRFLDIETTGVTSDSIPRSISTSEFVLEGVFSGGEMRLEATQTLTPTGEPVDLGARFITPEMGRYPVRGEAGQVTNLAEEVARKESIGTSFIDAQGNVQAIDIRTTQGVQQAKLFYEQRLTMYADANSFLVAQNGLFDVQKMVDGARSVGVSEDIIESFLGRMRSGGLVDTLSLTRSKLMDDLYGYFNSQGNLSPEEKMNRAVSYFFSSDALHKARAAGEGIKGFGLENIIESSNFLELLAEQAQGGDQQSRDLLNKLANSQSAHIDVTDRQVLERLFFDFLGSEKDRFGSTLAKNGVMSKLDPTKTLQEVVEPYMNLIMRAKVNVGLSSAALGLTIFTDPKMLLDEVFQHVIDEGSDAFRKVELDLTTFLMDRGATYQDHGVMSGVRVSLKYDPDNGSFEFFQEGRRIDNPALRGLLNNQSPEDFIKSTLTTIRSGRVGPSTPAVASLGLSALQQMQMHAVSRIVTSNQAPAVQAVRRILQGGNQSTLSLEGDTEALLRGLTAGRRLIGYNESSMPIGGLNDEVTSLMRGQFIDNVNENTEAYRLALHRAGISAASVDPILRSTFVELSHLTVHNTAHNRRFLEDLVRQSRPGTSDDLVQTIVTGMVGAIEREGSLLRELGVLAMPSQQRVVAGETLPLIPTRELLQVQLPGGESFFDQQIPVRVSIPTREVPTVNIIYGGLDFYPDLMANEEVREKMQQRAIATYDHMHERLNQIAADSGGERVLVSDVIESGLVGAVDNTAQGRSAQENAAQRIIDQFSFPRLSEEGAQQFSRFEETFIGRGVGIASDESGLAESVARSS